MSDDRRGDPSGAAARAAELRALIKGYDAQYYLEDASDIPDAEYDALKDELLTLEDQHPELVQSDSPTQSVGIAPSPLFAAVAHRTPMMSLDKVTTLEEILAWGARLQRILAPESGSPFVCEPKIDGLSISLTYERGRLVRGATRGDGRVGEDVTPNVRTLKSIPAELDLPDGEIPEILEARGEVYFPIVAFEELNHRQTAAGLPTFSNPRNAAAGSLRQKDSSITAGRALGAFFYQVDGVSGLTTQSGSIDLLKRAGLPVNPETTVVSDLESVFAYCRDMESRRHGLGYEIDGVVVKVEDLALHAPARDNLARAALGGGVQIPARGAHDASRRHPRLDRTNRKSDAVREASTGADRRLGRRARQPAQRGPGPAEGRTSGRYGGRPQGG